ncbi:MAG TPA: NAD(P)-binding protein, partial [Stenomitos sp.]
MSEDNSPIGSEFLVCGLGTLGQSCVSMLKSFGAIVYGIDCAEIRYWEVPDLPHKLDGYWQGDCRQVQILEQANVHRCRAILLVTRDERTNLAAAFAARTLNPTLRIIVRSRQDNLNQLLSRHLGNFAAFEPERLTAIALSAAATGDEV